MRAFTIMSSDIARCPDRRLDPAHYREDGSCLHQLAPEQVCQWFALCDRPATQVVAHPVLDLVPACDRCAARAVDQ